VSQQAHLVRRLTAQYVQQLRARLATTSDDAAKLVDKLDHRVTENLTAMVCKRLGLKAEESKPHPWAGKGGARSTRETAATGGGK
jgi:hypothetical protein